MVRVIQAEKGITPYGTHVMIKADPSPSQTESGIILPETMNHHAGNPLVAGTILKVGSKWNEETGDGLEPGDRVLFQVIGSTQTVDEKGDEIYFVRDTHHPRAIVAKLTDD